LVGAKKRSEQLQGGLDAPLSPASLLSLEGADLGRQLGRDDDVGQIPYPPAAQLSAVAEVEILRQRVPLPAAGVLDAGPPPDASGAVEVDKQPSPAPCCLLDDKVTVHPQCLGLGEERVVPVEMSPTGLDAADGGVSKVGDNSLQKVWRGKKIGIKDGHQFPFGLSQASGQRPGLETGPVQPRDVDHICPLSPQTSDGPRRYPAGGIGRIVENLDLQPVARVVQPGRCGQQPLDGVQLVVDGQLNGDVWPLDGRR